jgi:hypothetical protein
VFHKGYGKFLCRFFSYLLVKRYFRNNAHYYQVSVLKKQKKRERKNYFAFSKNPLDKEKREERGVRRDSMLSG